MLFRADVPELLSRFEDAAGLHFLGVPANQLSKVAVLLDQVGVQSLAESVDWRVAANTKGTENRKLTDRIRSLVRPVARVVYWFGHSRFKAAIDVGAFNVLSTINVVDVKTLEMDAVLAGNSRKTTGDAVLENGTLFLRQGAPAAIDQVAREIRKLFVLPEAATDIFTRLLLSSSEFEADEYLRVVKHIVPLPQAEEMQLLNGAIEEELNEDMYEAPQMDLDTQTEENTSGDQENAARVPSGSQSDLAVTASSEFKHAGADGSLGTFAWLLTLHAAPSGRVYAAYGGVYVAVALGWL